MYDALFYGSPILLLLACGLILWLMWSNQKLSRIVGELEIAKAIEHQRGWAECEAKWRNEPIYKMGYAAGDRAGYVRACHEQAAMACEMQLVRESGELSS